MSHESYIDVCSKCKNKIEECVCIPRNRGIEGILRFKTSLPPMFSKTVIDSHGHPQTVYCPEDDDHLFHARQLMVTTHFIVDLGFEQHPRGIITLRTLRELITDVIRLHEPDTLSVTLTTGDRPLDLSQQATALVIESSSKTGNSFPISNFANLQFSSADATIASVIANGDGTATVTPVAVGTTTISCTDTSNGLTGSVGVSVTAVVADAPDTLTLTLSPPFPAGTSGNAPKAAVSGAKPVN